jgi:hypothetical protein
VLGANDGIISTAGLVIGVAAATTDSGEIATAGIAGLVAGAVSMALGEYVSVSTQRDTERALIAKEKVGILAALKAKVGEKFADYEGMKVCELRLCAKVIADYEATLEKVPEVSSGASGTAIQATETPVPADKKKEQVQAALKVAEAALGRKFVSE